MNTKQLKEFSHVIKVEDILKCISSSLHTYGEFLMKNKNLSNKVIYMNYSTKYGWGLNINE